MIYKIFFSEIQKKIKIYYNYYNSINARYNTTLVYALVNIITLINIIGNKQQCI